MNVSGPSSAFAQNYAVAVAKKSQDAQKVTDQTKMDLIASAGNAAPKLQAGQTINVMA
jgi:hypothetical protein